MKDNDLSAVRQGDNHRNLRRSVESARLFFPQHKAAVTDTLYREAELPTRLPVCGLAMRFSAAVAGKAILMNS